MRSIASHGNAQNGARLDGCGSGSDRVPAANLGDTTAESLVPWVYNDVHGGIKHFSITETTQLSVVSADDDVMLKHMPSSAIYPDLHAKQVRFGAARKIHHTKTRAPTPSLFASLGFLVNDICPNCTALATPLQIKIVPKTDATSY